MEGRISPPLQHPQTAKIVDGASTTARCRSASIVELRYVGDDDTEKYLLGSIEERQPGVTVVSPGSPLGEALLGAKPGQKVSYEAPGGVLQVEVVKIG